MKKKKKKDLRPWDKAVWKQDDETHKIQPTIPDTFLSGFPVDPCHLLLPSAAQTCLCLDKVV